MLHFEPYLNVLPNILFAFAIGFLLTPLLRKIGLRYEFSDKPPAERDPNSRGYITRYHTKTMPRLGEFAMLVPLFLLMWKDLSLNPQLLGIVMSIALVGFVGAYDAKYNFSDFTKLFALLFAGILLIFTGTIINIESIIHMNSYGPSIINPITTETIHIASIILTLGWLVVIPTALSYVGGVDGLSEGTSAIAFIILTLIGIREGNLLTVTIGSLCLGGVLGLLPYNFFPAVIYSEHLIYGFIIAILAITTKGKITTSILIVTIPLIDYIAVCFYRTKKYFKENKGFSLRIWLHYLGTGDRNHLHHRLLDMGFKPVQVTLIQYAMYAALGFISLAVSGLYLTFAILGSILAVVLILYWLNKKVLYGRS